jgi:hypothetical protein
MKLAYTIVQGTKSTNPYFKNLAYQELHALASNTSRESAFHMALFNSPSAGRMPWETLVREAIAVLEADRKLLLGRSAVALPSAYF